ncbi:GntR family transcriptional regulator [Ruegeria sp.]|uniref:GntR family transcriptional regulator n=1 Tax=Ruegeria sp. TaxID=1879320 RepID=UPI003B5957AB
MTTPAKQRKKTCYGEIRSAVLTGAMSPGSDLDETTLSEKFELSRTSFREVVSQLAGEGYLELRSNRGARVSEISPKAMRDFFLTAPMVYRAVLRLAVRHATKPKVAKLKQTQEAFKSALRSGTLSDRALANNQFHETAGKMAGNVYLLSAFNRLLIDHTRISMGLHRSQDDHLAKYLSQTSAQNDAIIAAIEAGDEEEADQLAVRYWNFSRDQIERFFMPPELSIPLGTITR